MIRNVFLSLTTLVMVSGLAQAQNAGGQTDAKQISYNLTESTEFAAADTTWQSVGDAPTVANTSLFSEDFSQASSVMHSVSDCKGDCSSCRKSSGNCASGACGACRECGDKQRYLRRTWTRFDYLYWDVPGYYTPALVTTAPQGVLPTLPGATVQFGNGLVDDGYRSGGRVQSGIWFDDEQIAGVQFEFFGLGGASTNFNLASNSNPSLGIPFFNTNPGVNAEDAILVANFAGGVPTLTGDVSVVSSSNIYSAGFLLRHLLVKDRHTRVDFLGGYRYFKMDEGLSLSSSTTSQSATSGLAVGTVIDINDVFDTDNDFNGGEFGVNISRSRGCWSLDVLAKVALGSNRQTVRINGQTSVTVPNVAPVITNQGVFSQSSVPGYTGNIGQYDRSQFMAIPELGVTVGYQATKNIRTTFGYTFIYLSDVVRPGNQIDRNVNGTLFTPNFNGPQTPQLRWDSRDAFMYGFSFGAELTF